MGAVVVIGVPMWLGLLPGSRNPLLTLLPAAAALATIVGTLAAARLGAPGGGAPQRRARPRGGGAGRARRRGGGRGGADPRATTGACWERWGTGVWDIVVPVRVPRGVRLRRRRSGRSRWPTWWGCSPTRSRSPGGFFAVEGGFVGMLLLFGVRPGSTVLAAVVTYRAISLWIPALIGTVAFLSLRGEIGKPLRPRPAAPPAPSAPSRQPSAFAEQRPSIVERRRRRAGRRARGARAAPPARPPAGARRDRGSRRAAVGRRAAEPGALSGRSARTARSASERSSEKTSIMRRPL